VSQGGSAFPPKVAYVKVMGWGGVPGTASSRF
jgi:hypothetical protein